jgi:integrase
VVGQPGIKPRTRKGLRDARDGHVLPVFGPRRLAAITPADARETVQQLKGKGLAPATVRQAFAPLRRVLAQAVADQELTWNPYDGGSLSTTKTENRPTFRTTFLTEEQVAELAAQQDATEPVYGLLVRFLAYTVLRASELAGLDVCDLDLLRREVHVVWIRPALRTDG